MPRLPKPHLGTKRLASGLVPVLAPEASAQRYQARFANQGGV